MSGTKKIIIVDDDDMLRETLTEQFSLHDEFAVTEAATAAAAAAAADSPRPRGSESPLSPELDCTICRVASANV